MAESPVGMLRRVFRVLAFGILASGLGASCDRAAGAATVELALQQQDGKPLAEAVLIAYALDGRPLPQPVPAVMDQQGRKFTPHILPVQTRARVRFPNSDNVSHHVYSFSAAQRFQLYLTKGGPAKDVTFDHPGVVTLGCNLHDWMLGYILVLDTPYFAQTDAAGLASLTGLPTGKYRLEVWHPRITDGAPQLRREVELLAAGKESWSLRLARALLPARDQRPGFAEY